MSRSNKLCFGFVSTKVTVFPNLVFVPVAWTKTTAEQKDWLSEELGKINSTKIVYPSDANFILVKMDNAKKVYEFLTTKGIIVRDRSKVILCDDCLRITIGTPEENKKLVLALNDYSK